MLLILNYRIPNTNEIGVLTYVDGKMITEVFACDIHTKVEVFNAYLSIGYDTSEKTMVSKESYTDTIANLRWLMENGEWDGLWRIVPYAQKHNVPVLSLLHRDTLWYIFDKEEDLVEYLCSEELIDMAFVDVYKEFGIEFLNISNICKAYTTTSLDGYSYAFFAYDKHDSVWYNIIWEEN